MKNGHSEGSKHCCIAIDCLLQAERSEHQADRHHEGVTKALPKRDTGGSSLLRQTEVSRDSKGRSRKRPKEMSSHCEMLQVSTLSSPPGPRGEQCPMPRNRTTSCGNAETGASANVIVSLRV